MGFQYLNKLFFYTKNIEGLNHISMIQTLSG